MVVHKMVLQGIVMFLTVPSCWSTRLNHQKVLDVDSLAPMKSHPGVLLNISSQTTREEVSFELDGETFEFQMFGTGDKLAIVLMHSEDISALEEDDVTALAFQAGYRAFIQTKFVEITPALAGHFAPALQDFAKTYMSDADVPFKLPLLVGVGKGVDLAAQVAHDLEGSVEHLALVEAHLSDGWAKAPWTFHKDTKVAFFHSQEKGDEKEGDEDFTVKGEDIFPKFQGKAMMFQWRGNTKELVVRFLPTIIAFAMPSLRRDSWKPGPLGPQQFPLPQEGAEIEIKTFTGEPAKVKIVDGTEETSVGNVPFRQFGSFQEPEEGPKKVAFAFGGAEDADFNTKAPEWTHIAAHLAEKGFLVFVPIWQKATVPNDGKSWALALQEIVKKHTDAKAKAEDLELPLLMGKCAGGQLAVEVSKELKQKVLRRVFVVPASGVAADVAGFGPTALFYGKDDPGFGPSRQKDWQTFTKDEALVFQADAKGHRVLGDYIPFVVDFAMAGREKLDLTPAGFPAPAPGDEADEADEADETPWHTKSSTYMYGALILIFIGAAAYGAYHLKFRQDSDAAKAKDNEAED